MWAVLGWTATCSSSGIWVPSEESSCGCTCWKGPNFTHIGGMFAASLSPWEWSPNPSSTGISSDPFPVQSRLLSFQFLLKLCVGSGCQGGCWMYGFAQEGVLLFHPQAGRRRWISGVLILFGMSWQGLQQAAQVQDGISGLVSTEVTPAASMEQNPSALLAPWAVRESAGSALGFSWLSWSRPWAKSVALPLLPSWVQRKCEGAAELMVQRFSNLGGLYVALNKEFNMASHVQLSVLPAGLRQSLGQTSDRASSIM